MLAPKLNMRKLRHSTAECDSECLVPERIVLDEEEWAAFSAEIASPRKPSAALRAMFKR